MLVNKKGEVVAAQLDEETTSEPLATTTPSVATVLASIAKYNEKNDQNAFSLKEYTEHELENRKDSKSIEVYTGRVQGMNFINKVLTDNSFKGKLYFRKVDEVLAAAIEEATGLDVEDDNLVLHADEVRKIAESHGSEASENLRRQSAI